MKRTISFVVMLMFMMQHPVSAQDRFIGFKGGITIPNLKSGDDHVMSQGYKSRLASTVGIFYEKRLGAHLAAQVELNYSGQGGIREGMQPQPRAKVIHELETIYATRISPELYESILKAMKEDGEKYFYADLKHEANLKYLELPLMMKYYLDKRQSFYVSGGVNLAYLVKARSITSGMGELFRDPEGKESFKYQWLGADEPFGVQNFAAETNIIDDLHRFNVGLQGGFGIQLPFWVGFLCFDARVVYGLTRLQKDVEANGNTKTGGLIVAGGYGFKL